MRPTTIGVFRSRKAWAVVWLAISSAALAQSVVDLKPLSLDELVNVEVTSVSRRSEKLIDASAAVQVLTGDEITRAGAMTLPDALRLATGLQVSQLDGREWAISARGFASVASEKMEVSMDGRSLYGPLFSGVLWDVQSVVLEDLDRIEIVRGPGAALWGANAVNGVINIVTKPAAETQGTLVQSTIGSENRQAVLRYGGVLSNRGFYRVYLHGWSTEGLLRANDVNAGDDRRMLKAGGRTDIPVGISGQLTVQTDIYRGKIGQISLPESTVQGGNGLARYEGPFSDEGKFRFQANYDHSERDIPGTYSEIRNTEEAFAEAELGGSQLSGTVGFRARISSDRVGNGPTLNFNPSSRTITLYGLYGQGSYTFPDTHWKIIAGSTLEHNSFTGFEVQPTLRVSYSAATWMAWIGGSRAVRTPSRVDTDIVVPGPGNLTILEGSPAFQSENVDALEAGWRWSRRSSFTVELNAFANQYHHLRSLEPGSGTVLFVNRNLLEGRTDGAELRVTYKPRPFIRLAAGARYLDKTLSLLPQSRSPNRGNYEGNDARRVGTIQASVDLPAHTQLDLVVRHVSRLPLFNVPGYTEGDVRLGWSPPGDWEFAISGRNLLHEKHQEGAQSGAPVEYVRRSVAVTVTWRH